MTSVTAVMIAYNNEVRSLIRLYRDLLPVLGPDTELIVIDNSTHRSEILARSVAAFSGRYQWNNGENIKYGPSMNQAVKLATSPYLLYVCSEHGESFDESWVSDLLAPLKDDDDDVVMTGTLYYSGPPENRGFPADLPPYHIQGGVFAARVDALRRFPYPEEQYAQSGSDIYECFQLVDNGLRLVDVPTIKSVYWKGDLDDGDYKYVHNSGRVDDA